MKIKKILIANRGEISLRIMRSAKEMGIKTVAVFSEADRKSPHVRFADEAVNIGPAPSHQSYLNMDKIIEVSLETGVDAIHPGYGFLSENATFAQKVLGNGLIFIGPSPASISIMGNKLAAKKAVSKYNIPMVPGTPEAISDLDLAKVIAKEIGYPLLLKASAGGGGKGMKIVEMESELENQLKRATSEAKSAFGDESVFLEKYITSPKHIEIQVLGDTLGNLVHLFERECSIQRRHQKVIEEAPSPSLDEKTRMEMGEAAIKVAQACNYYGAGTVEFIVDAELNFYFLEMNTRLQVEHPVTELISGKDLVKEQILIAEGKPLSFGQKDLYIHGHSIEARVYAEDPQNGFLPETGTLTTYSPPKGPGIRVDDGFEEGMEIPIYYDPMIAKLIVHAGDRDQAIQKMLRAIEEYPITGIKTTLDFCKYVLQHEEFQTGTFNTGFVEDHFHPEAMNSSFTQEELELLASFGVFIYENQQKGLLSNNHKASSKTVQSNWKTRRFNG